MTIDQDAPVDEPVVEPAAADPAACSWPVSYVGCEDCWPDDITTPEQRAPFEDMAVWLLGTWTNGKYGQCPATVRPCRVECLGRTSTFWGRGPFPWMDGGTGWVPVLLNGQWFNVACGACGRPDCSCDLGCADLVLPGPIASVESVTIGVDTVPPTSYRVDDYRHLVRTDGQCWPACQDMLATAGEAGSFVVTYTRGAAVPLGGQVAAGRLACELAKAACGDATCMLPKRVQTVTRQGVTIGLLDSFDDIDKGRTGIWLVDSWVSAAQTTPPQRSRVYSVDVPTRKVRRTTWTA